jgi:hypothetical protein
MSGRRQCSSSFLGSVLLTFALLVGAGCGPMGEPDTDDEMLKAKGLLANTSEVTDSVDPEAGDKTDWRVFEHFEKANVKVTYRVGDPFKGHDVRGVIEVFDAVGNKLVSKSVVPGTIAYELQFTAEANTKYFIVFNASHGAARYLIDAKAAPVDPCAACTADELCEGGRCVPKPRGCRPACQVGYECDEDRGRCVEIECDEGEFFDKVEGECRPDLCAKKKCGKGQTCRVQRGRATCVSGTPAPPRECKPACKAGETCRNGKCVGSAPVAEGPKCPAECPKGQTCDPKTGTCKGGPISGKILNFWPEGKDTVMLLNRGSEHGIKKGMGGSIGGGGEFTVIEVYPYQCRAKTKLSKDEMVGKKSVTFK